jgi:hypothetical protein
MRPRRHPVGLAAVCAAVIVGIVGVHIKREERLDKMTVPQLLRLYASSPGADDAVGPEFKRRGASARDELIRMLDAVPTADSRSDAVGTIVDILKYEFPSQETYAPWSACSPVAVGRRGRASNEHWQCSERICPADIKHI